MSITEETRRESHEFTKPKKPNRYNDILKVLSGKQMTSNEIRRELGFNDLNSVRPRLTELRDKGFIEVVGKKYDTSTERNVAVYQIKK